MNIGKKAIALFVGIAVVAGLSACSGSRGGASKNVSQGIEKGATIGVSMPTKSEERWNKDGNNLKKKLEDAGYKVILNFADDKPAQQNADIENMINNGAKVVVVAAKDGSAVGPAVEKAHDAGAKVIAYDRLIMNTKAVDYYATFQLEQTGILEANYIIDKLGLKDGAKGPFNIELFTGSPDDNNAKYFFKGAWDLLQPYFKSGALVSPSNHGGGVNKDFKVQDWQKISVQGWKAEQAQKDMESIIDSAYAKGQPLHAILSPYDGISTGVINAIESKRPDLKPGTDNWPIITGQDAMESAVSSIARGKQSQTVFKNV
ncbi:ABC transporter substrate-binding protein, partial [Gardnerella vaginalis]